MANRKIYLVDSENVSCEWLALCPKLGSRDNIVLFYTEKSPFISYPNLVRILPYLEKLELVQCYMGPNALDFQMCTYLGAKLAKPTKTEYFIVSNDRGYQPVVKFWKDRGRLISQINHAGLMRLTAENKQKTLGKQPTKPVTSAQKPAPAVLEAVRDVVQQEMAKPESDSVQTEGVAVGHSVPPVPKKIVSKTAGKSSVPTKCTPKKQPEEKNPSTKADQPTVAMPTPKEAETVPTKEETTTQPAKSTSKRSTKKSSLQKKAISTHPHSTTNEESSVPATEETPMEQFVTAPKPKKRTTRKAPVKKERQVSQAKEADSEPEAELVKEEPKPEQFVTAPKPKKRTAKKTPAKKTVKPKTKMESATKEPHIRTKVKENQDMSKAELNRMIETVIGDSMPLKKQSIDKISDVLLKMSTQKLTLVHSGLVKAFDAQMGRDIYRVLKPELPRIFKSINPPAN